MLSLLSKLMKNFVNEVKFLINFFYVEYKLFVLRYHRSTKRELSEHHYYAAVGSGSFFIAEKGITLRIFCLFVVAIVAQFSRKSTGKIIAEKLNSLRIWKAEQVNSICSAFLRL